jgi:hypothetical protein
VIACVNTQRRKTANQRAGEGLAWRNVVRQITDDSDGELTEAQAKLRADVTRRSSITPT